MFTTTLSRHAQAALALLGSCNPNDIAAMKVAAIMDRGTKKDFIDMYFLVKKGISLDTSFENYEKKYKAFSNNLYSIMLSLTYFEQAEESDMPEMLEPIGWETVKEFFKKEAVRLGNKYLS